MADDNIIELGGGEITPESMVARLARYTDDIAGITIVVEWKPGDCAVYTCVDKYKDLVYHAKVLEMDIARRLGEHWKTTEQPVDHPRPF